MPKTLKISYTWYIYYRRRTASAWGILSEGRISTTFFFMCVHVSSHFKPPLHTTTVLTRVVSASSVPVDGRSGLECHGPPRQVPGRWSGRSARSSTENNKNELPGRPMISMGHRVSPRLMHSGFYRAVSSALVLLHLVEIRRKKTTNK